MPSTHTRRTPLPFPASRHLSALRRPGAVGLLTAAAIMSAASLATPHTAATAATSRSAVLTGDTAPMPALRLAAYSAPAHRASTTHKAANTHKAVAFHGTAAAHVSAYDRSRIRALAPQLQRLRFCESGGNYRIATGNGYYGAYQFDLSTWHSMGLGGTPNHASKQLQDVAVARLEARKGWSPWPVCGRRV